MEGGKSPMGRPIERVFRASLLILGAAIALHVAIGYLEQIWPWLIGGVALFVISWLVIAIVRWRRSRW